MGDDGFTAWLMRDTFGVEASDTTLPSWHRDAACRDVEGVTWFPEVGDDWRQAVAVCEGCPVRQECLDHALDADERHGVWGGLTPRQRAELARQAA